MLSDILTTKIPGNIQNFWKSTNMGVTWTNQLTIDDTLNGNFLNLCVLVLFLAVMSNVLPFPSFLVFLPTLPFPALGYSLLLAFALSPPSSHPDHFSLTRSFFLQVVLTKFYYPTLFSPLIHRVVTVPVAVAVSIVVLSLCKGRYKNIM